MGWHRIEYGRIVECRETPPDCHCADAPGEAYAAGWRFAQHDTKPFFDAQKEKLEEVTVYDGKTDTVTETWKVVALDYAVIAGLARKDRLIKKLAKTDIIAAIAKKEGLL